jgi:hypothetical protein
MPCVVFCVLIVHQKNRVSINCYQVNHCRKVPHRYILRWRSGCDLSVPYNDFLVAFDDIPPLEALRKDGIRPSATKKAFRLEDYTKSRKDWAYALLNAPEFIPNGYTKVALRPLNVRKP